MDKDEQTEMDVGPQPEVVGKAPWPKTMPEQISVVRAVLAQLGEGSPDEVARQFQRGRPAMVRPLLESLAVLGQAYSLEDGKFAAVRRAA